MMKKKKSKQNKTNTPPQVIFIKNLFFNVIHKSPKQQQNIPKEVILLRWHIQFDFEGIFSRKDSIYVI